MIDLELLNYPPQEVSPDQFRLWRSHPCTQELCSELALAFFALLDEDLPFSIDESVCMAHQREGIKETINQIFDWEPSSIRERRKASADGRVEGVDDEN
jgi:hypothetical protein